MNNLFFHLFTPLLLLMLSAMFSGTEAAFFSLKKSDLYRLSRSQKTGEKRIARYMSEPDKLLITLLMGNLFVNLMLTALVTSFLLDRFGHYGHFVSIGLITPVIILLGEITPKILAIHSYLSVTRFLFPIFRIFHKILTPLRFFIIFITDIVIRVFNLNLAHSLLTADELGYVVSSGEKQGLIDKKESDIIKNVIRFSNREAANIMYPRNQAIFIHEDYTIREAMEVIIENDIVRVPVYRNDIDDIIGMIDSRDIMSSYLGYRKKKYVKEFITPVNFYPFSKDLNELLQDFLQAKIQLAIIVDEYGGTAGVVTLNTILSSLLGRDFSKWEQYKKSEIRAIENNRFIVPGDVQLDEFNTFFSTELASNNSDTIGGLILEKMNNFPSRGDVIKIDNLEIRIRNIVKRNIRSVEIIRSEADGE